MRTTNTIKNDCEHCASGAMHYYNLNGIFRQTNCLHCIHGKMTIREKESRLRNRKKCEYWQPEQILIGKRDKNIELLLLDIAHKLQDVAQILKEEHDLN